MVHFVAIEIVSWPLIIFGGVGGVAVLVGFVFRWWGLLATAGLMSFLAYVWDAGSVEGLYYTLLVGMVALVGVILGTLVRDNVYGSLVRDRFRR